MPCSVNFHKGGVWHKAKKVFIHKAGAWHEAVSTSIHKGGAWHVCSSTVAEKPLTGAAKTFLKPPASHHYSGVKPSGWNKTMETLPEDDIFPYGQQMPLIGHDMKPKYVPIALASGFNVGYQQNRYEFGESLYNAVKNTSMKYMGYLRDVTGDGKVATADSPARATKEMKKYLDDTRLDIYGWMLPYDDWADENYAQHATNVKNTNIAINNYRHPRLRHNAAPFGALGTGQSNLTGKWNSVIRDYTSIAQQTYTEGPQCVPTADKNWTVGRNKTFKTPMLVAVWANAILKDINHSASGKPWLVPFMDIQAWQRYENNHPAHENNVFYKTHMTHNILNAFIGGCNSFMWYQMDDLWAYGERCAKSQAYVTKAFADVFELFKIMTENKVDRAFLWGKGAKPSEMISGRKKLADYHSGNAQAITARVTRGPAATTFICNWGVWNTGLNRPLGTGGTTMEAVDQLAYRDIQFKGERFVIATNSNPPNNVLAFYGKSAISNNGHLNVTFSGFPTTQRDELKVVDLLTDTIHAISATGTIAINMPPMGSVILKVMPADGYVGGDTGGPVTPETQLPYSQIPANVRTWIETITGGVRVSDIQPDDYRFRDRSRGEVYAYQDADHIVFYWPGKGDAHFNFATFATHADVHWMKDNGESLNHEIGIAHTIQYNDGTNAGATVYKKVSGGTGEQPPTATRPANQSVQVKGTAKFTTTVTGHGTVLWQFSTGGTTFHDIIGENGLTYTINSATILQNGYKYRVRVSNSAGFTYSGAGTLHVSAIAAKPTISGPADAGIKVGERATYTIVAENFTNLQWQWKKPATGTWIDIPDTSRTHHTDIQTSTRWDGSMFRCIVTGAGGSTTSREALLSVSEATFVIRTTQAAFNWNAPHLVSITFNGAVVIVDKSGISAFNDPYVSYMKNHIATGNKFMYNIATSDTSIIQKQVVTFRAGSITVDGHPIPNMVVTCAQV